MPQDTQFADALMPPPAMALGLPLRRYSLGHERVLLSERNAFLLKSPIEFTELPFEQKVFCLHRATWICSNSNHQNDRELFPRWIKRKILSWRRRNLTEDDYGLAVAEFWNYLNAGRSCPRLSRRRPKVGEEPGRAFGAPLLAQLLHFVLELPEVSAIQNSRRRADAAYDFPFGEAVWRYFVKMETDGAIQIENESEEAQRLKIEKSEMEFNERLGAWKLAATDEQKRAAIEKYPLLRSMAATMDEVAAFEKGALK